MAQERWRSRNLWLLLLFALVPATVQAQTGKIYIDPDDSRQILSTQIPFTTQVLLTIDELPPISEVRSEVPFGGQKFSYITPSPDQNQLAFSVDGTQHDWSGVLLLSEKKVEQLSLCFEGEAKKPYWSQDGRFLVVEEGASLDRQYLEIFDLEEGQSCRLDGRRAKNKYLNFSKPWWKEDEDRVYFKVDYNNTYRKSLGLRAKKVPSRIGEVMPDCRKVRIFSAKEFMKKFPAEAQAPELSAIQTEESTGE